MGLVIPHEKETRDDKDPVHIVRDYSAVGGGVVPPENGIEDTPAAATVKFGVTALFKERQWLSVICVV